MNLSLKQYRTLDLVIFAVLISVFEAINIFAITEWFTDELFTISLLIPLTAIVIMRWGAYGVIHAGLSGLAYCMALSTAQNISWEQYLVYIVGNCFVGLSMLLFLAIKKNKIVQSTWYSALFVAMVFLAVEIGRTLVSVCLGSGIQVFVHFVTTDSLSAAAGLVVVLIARKQNGLFEDQIYYLRRLEQERDEARKLKDEGMQ